MSKRTTSPQKSNRSSIRYQILAGRKRFFPHGYSSYCSLCGKSATALDLHEVLLTRGDFTGTEHEFLWSENNCAQLCRACHVKATTKENQERLIRYLIDEVGAENILQWLLSIKDMTKGNQINYAILRVKELRND